MRSFKKVLATAVAGVLLALGVQAPALAAWSDCNSGYLCIYDGTSGTGLMYQWTVGYILTLSDDCLVLTGSQNNMASSVYFRGSLAGSNKIYLTSEPSGLLSPSRTISTAGYQDADMAASPGISGFGNTVSRICIRTS